MTHDLERICPKQIFGAVVWLLCQWPRWITGTYEDYMEHYRLTHQKEE